VVELKGVVRAYEGALTRDDELLGWCVAAVVDQTIATGPKSRGAVL